MGYSYISPSRGNKINSGMTGTSENGNRINQLGERGTERIQRTSTRI